MGKKRIECAYVKSDITAAVGIDSSQSRAEELQKVSKIEVWSVMAAMVQKCSNNFTFGKPDFERFRRPNNCKPPGFALLRLESPARSAQRIHFPTTIFEKDIFIVPVFGLFLLMVV